MDKPKLKQALNEIIGPSLKNLKDLVIELAKTNRSTLLIGETGTGKELFARLFMAASPRTGNIESISCAGFASDNLLLSELFGHVEGAYTDAIRKRNGLIQSCNQGVIFLDELGHAREGASTSLLRYLQSKDFKALGSDKSKNSDVCIIGAASKEEPILPELKMRFQVLYIPEIALRDRDIYFLIKHFLIREKLEKITQEALNILLARRYPGNIRELEKIIAASAVMASIDNSKILRKKHITDVGSRRPILLTEKIKKGPNKTIKVEEIDPGEKTNLISIEKFWKPFVHPETKSINALLSQARQKEKYKPAQIIAEPLYEIVNLLKREQADVASMTWKEMQKFYLQELLKKTGGNKKEAAKLAKLPQSTFHNKLTRQGIK